jgi:uncharacterized protein
VEPILHLSLPVDDLESSRRFYVDVLGCEPGRDRTELGFVDVWFYGLQLTLQEQPGQHLTEDQHGARHFGVALDRAALDELLARLRASSVRWMAPISTDTTGTLGGKTSVKILDPSGNVIELKSYDDARSALDAP